MNTAYRLRRNTCTGSVKLTYRNGELFGVETTLKNKLTKQYITVQQAKALFRWVGRYIVQESQLADVKAFKVTRLEKAIVHNAQAGKNMAIWKKAYQEFFKVAYTHTSRELKLLETIEMTNERVTAYFKCTEWWADRNVIEQFVKVQNELNQHLIKAQAGNPEAVKAQTGNTSRFPNYWDEDIYNRLKGQQKNAYGWHLRKQGLIPVKYMHYPYYLLGFISKQQGEEFGYEGEYKDNHLVCYTTGHKQLFPPANDEKKRDLDQLIGSVNSQFKTGS